MSRRRVELLLPWGIADQAVWEPSRWHSLSSPWLPWGWDTEFGGVTSSDTPDPSPGVDNGHFCAIHCSWDPTSSKDLLWESQIQAEAQFLVPGQLCTALVHSVVRPSNVHMF